MHVVKSEFATVFAVMEEGRVVESGELIEVFKSTTIHYKTIVGRKNVWMMKSMKYSITYQRPFIRGSFVFGI